MAEHKIEFRKTRDFGENLNDTFLFIKLNFKPLFKSFFAICSLFMLGLAIFNGLYLARFATVWQDMFKANKFGPNNLGQVFNFQYFMTISLVTLTIVAMKVALVAYVKYYVENDGQKPGIEEVWNIFKKYFLRVFLFSIPIGLMVVVGCFLCLVPGIYLWVVFVPFSTIIIMEDASFSTAYSRCFELIKDNFWMSFGIYIVAYLIYYISWSLVGAFITVIIKLGNYVTTDDLNQTAEMVKSFLNIFAFSFYIVYVISIIFNYFNLVETKDATGILNRINKIGSKKNDFDNIEEQY